MRQRPPKLDRLTALIDIKHGFAFSSEFFDADGNHVLLTPGNFFESGGYRELGAAQKRYSGPVPSDFILQPGAVLIAMTEQAPGLLGSTLRVPSDDTYLHNQRLGLLIIRQPARVCSEYLYHVFNDSRVRNKISTDASGTKVKHTSPSKLAAIEVFIPEIEAQQKIAGLLDSWDRAIEKAERLITAKEYRLQYIRERSMSKRETGSRTPLHTATLEITSRNGAALGRESIMAVTKEAGMRPMRAESIASDIARYKVVPPQAFAYNPMRLNIGSIAMSSFESDVLVSPDYVVFACDESKLLPGYLNHLRHTRHWRSYFGQAGNGSVRVRIYYDDLGAFTFPLPPVDVQARIVRFLDAATKEIALLRQQAEALRKQKCGLMQKLLTGEWRLPLRGEEAV